jgi:hypothetical protein
MKTSTFPKTRVIVDNINELNMRLNFGLIKPYPASLERRDLIVKGLSVLFEECGTLATGKPIGSATGNDILIQCQKVEGGLDHTFGETLAELLNTVPVHYNSNHQKGFVGKGNSWLYISQYYAEELLLNAANRDEQLAATA